MSTVFFARCIRYRFGSTYKGSMSSKQNSKIDVANTVAENLRALRGELSQSRFARLIGIEHSVTYHRYENGRLPKPSVLQTAAERLGIEVSELMTPIPAKRAFELQERALMLCFEPTPPIREIASAAPRDSFSKPDFDGPLWGADDAELGEAMKFFLKASIDQSGVVIDLCQQMVKAIRLEQRRRAVAGKKASKREGPSASE